MTMPDLELFKQKLQERIDADPEMTVNKLSVKAGLASSSIRAILVGKSKSPELATFLAICKALDLSLDEFLAGERSPTEKEMLRLLSKLTVGEQLQLLGIATDFAAERDMARQTRFAGSR